MRIKLSWIKLKKESSLAIKNARERFLMLVDVL